MRLVGGLVSSGFCASRGTGDPTLCTQVEARVNSVCIIPNSGLGGRRVNLCTPLTARLDKMKLQVPREILSQNIWWSVLRKTLDVNF